ncbi:MAG: hypothetical protein LBD04_03800 [Synergistaceae bacterium]|jgi:D-glycero-alpha-D-manno-heptose-7-phosphate kinase|nr:hypothetical protein [Synergistaceae bacterium]
MIISRTPFRVSFFGGGTDYPTWVERHGGAVLSTSIDKYNYITCRELPPFFQHKHRLSYSKVEDVTNTSDIQHPALRAVLANYLEGEGLEIHCDADLPARSGIGSSSSFMVGLLHALEALKGRRVAPEWLAREAIRYEQKILGETVGYQDQVAVAFGGFNIIYFMPGENFKVEPLILPPGRKNDLEKHLMLFFTGFARFASDIAKSQVDNFEKKSTELNRMRGMVDEAVDILTVGKDLRLFGELLHDAWIHKRSISDRVSTNQIDEIYNQARKHGAIGGKLLGAGGGGFIVFFVEPARKEELRVALKDLIHVNFNFENDGSLIIYYR